jgi:hypothetical protein
MRILTTVGLTATILTSIVTVVAVRAEQNPPPIGQRPDMPPVETLGPGLFRIQHITVDVKAREVRVPGHLNKVDVLEFIANTLGGFKAYESAMTLETNAVAFNTALLLIGMDKSRSRVPTQHFDPIPPEGDPVELWFERRSAPGKRRRVEDLLLDQRTKTTLPAGPWVYTGSTILSDGRYVAEVDGVLIGFVHSPAPIIENPRSGAVGAFGSFVMNPALGLPPMTPITLIVRAIDRQPRSSK